MKLKNILVTSVLLVGIVAATESYAIKMVYNKSDGNVTRFEPDPSQIVGNTIEASIVYENVDWDSIGFGSSAESIYSGSITNVYTNEMEEVIITTNLVEKTNINEFSDFVDEYAAYTSEVAYAASVVAGLKAEVWEIADRYEVTNSPLNWFTLKAAIKDVRDNTNETTEARQQARDDASVLTADSVFLKEWSVDLFNITR